MAKLGKAYRANAQKCFRCEKTAVARTWAKNGFESFMCQEHLERSQDARLLKKVKKI